MDQFTEQTAETASSTITVKQMGPHAGAEIHGINSADPLNELDIQTINDALMDNGVIIFRNQTSRGRNKLSSGLNLES